ncbi:hypothetical protein [Shewanella woodyi]|uniref:Uncharacterized protein n=1 Tax=Shewanella woodyi (strain ATCC 51908 / MS32) TaxID=392500 RepID=B1KG75_SHEWM|nr:hypothetical protein [Shewanella woodyi]ACA88212.1 conserved hypothetical protein [Shewanella woodyi ATCC 51908]
MDNEKQYLFDNPKNIQRVLYLLYACCTLLVILDFVIHRHVYHSWENLPIFYPIYGFVGCVILVLIASWMRTFLMRPEGYYDEPEADDNNHSTPTSDDDAVSGHATDAKKDIGDRNVDA